jgi:succinyl-diaminopimelate desuccinylase
LDSVIDEIRKVADGPEFKPVKIKIEVQRKDDSPPQTSADSEIVKLLRQAIKKQMGIDARTVGIGGGTAARFLRKQGFETAVWSTGDEVAHQPNEYLEVKNMVGDARVFAELFV